MEEKMLAKERQNEILNIIKRDKSIKMATIMKQFDVSHETARRDLDALQDLDLIERVYGGAVLPSVTHSEQKKSGHSPSETEEQSFSESMIRSSADDTARSGMDERTAIGRSAADLVKDGDTVFLSVGLTVQQVARALKNRTNITVLTNSVLVLNELIDTDVKLYTLGGYVNNSEDSIEGSLAFETLANFYVNIAFIGAGGISKKLGITDYSLDVASLNKRIIEQSSRTVLTAHARKFGKNCLNITSQLNKIQTVISDADLPQFYRDYLSENNVELILADPHRQTK